MPESVGEITNLLDAAHDGEQGALDRVMEIVYTDLHRIAERKLRQRYGREAADLTMQPTALVNEAYLKLIKQRNRYDSRGHFFAVATQVMLRVLMDYDRARRRARRGGDQVRISLSGVACKVGEEPSTDIPAFVEALEKLEKLDGRTTEVTKLRLLWGLTVPETAKALGISVTTVEREWRFARRWLAAELTKKAKLPPV